ncbi:MULTISPECIES: TetR/AcrR family transcriptional regulator [Streptomyces]|uniref:TetR/AcrR family transcriptional regulator n=1 Tax=Streptomyces gibsoniae TaxID=3075529 RepID=A0ABU2TKI9_9ACTN|nr:TetR/AcrR family transcriptional regulator [Streptomyces sp. DSM 41699]MDT0461442.1 TetR/AcrR family transcriptional regulator [Streptomyces sp. DSM 41699]
MSSARMSAEERREIVIRAALVEFARGGFNGTSTAAIARRSGVSQPYLFQLFPDKKALFLAAADRCFRTIRTALEEAMDGLTGPEAMKAAEQAWRGLVSSRDLLMMQLQVYVASVGAEDGTGSAIASEIAEFVRPLWRGLWKLVQERTGSSDAEVTHVFGIGMLINVLVAIGIPLQDHCWASITLDAPLD